MATVGIDRVYLGLFDENGNILTDATKGFESGCIEITDNMLGTNAVNVQISKTNDEVDGNNKEVSMIKSLPTCSFDVTFNNLPFDIQNKLLGRVKTGSGYVDTMVNTYAGIIARTSTMDYKDYVYYIMGKSVPTPKGRNMQTNTSKKTNVATDEFSFEGLACDRTNGMPYMLASSTEDSFSEKELFDQIFPGQTLITKADPGSSSSQNGQVITPTVSDSSSSASSSGVTA
ncbi:phage tail protein [Ligilactobacillus sp. LYQ135]